jgi:hypothetical protein
VQSIGDELTGLGLGTLSTAEDVLKDTVNEAGGLLKGLGDSLRGMESPQQK